jgi:hypothetical protein
VEFLIIILILTPFIILIFAFVSIHLLYIKEKSVEVENKRTRFYADNLGNYPHYFDPELGSVIDFPTGNPAFAQQTILLGDGSRPIPRKIGKAPTINRWDYSLAETSESELSELGEPGEPPEIYNKLIAAKRAGLPQTCILQITGCTKSGNPNSAYQKYLQIWKGI